MAPSNGSAAAYVCRNQSCRLPVSTPEELEKQLGPNPDVSATP